MYPLQGAPGEDEPGANESGEYFKRLVGEVVSSILIFCLIVTILKMAKPGEKEEIALRSLHYLTRGLQSTARVLGEWALHAEKSYNDIVDSLH